MSPKYAHKKYWCENYKSSYTYIIIIFFLNCLKIKLFTFFQTLILHSYNLLG